MKRILCIVLVLCLATGLHIPARGATNTVAICAGGQVVASYSDFQTALANCQSGQYLQLLQDISIEVNLTADLYIDLNGYSLSGSITPNGYKVFGMDSTTNGYGDADGNFLCSGITPERTVTTTADMTGQVYRYLAVETDGLWQFHRFYLGITHQSLDTAACGIGFKAIFCGNEEVVSQLDAQQAFGYSLQLNDLHPISVYKPREQFISERAVSLCIRNWDVENCADATLSAQVHLQLRDGTCLSSATSTLTFRQVVMDIDKNYTNYTYEQLDAVYALMQANPTMLTWGIQNIPAQPTCTHRDTDNNGLCDNCQISVMVSFDIYAINDLHGKFTDGTSQPGVDELTTYFKNARSQTENVILLSSGDMWQGGAESNLTRGLIITDWMNQLDFVSMTIGNHEYDWGKEAILANAELAEFPFLAINIYDSATKTQVDYCDSSVMVDLGEIQVGIIGAIGDCYSSISSDKVEDVYFITGDQLTQLVKAEAQKLRSQGADFIVYSLHDGRSSGNNGTSATTVSSLSYYDMALSNGYVDLVFEGHTHQRYLLKDSYGVYHVQGGGDNSGISYASVSLNFANGNSSVSAKVINKSSYAALTPDPVVAQLLEKYKEQISSAYEVLGYNRYYRSSDTICDTVAQLYCDLGEAVWGDEYDIVLGGGFLQCRSPYNLYAGEVTYDMLLSLLPFDNQIVLCKINGKYLYDRFINSSNDSYHIAMSDYAQANPPIYNSGNTYYVVVDSYTANYAYNNLTIVEEFDPGVYARDLLAEYIRDGNWD